MTIADQVRTSLVLTAAFTGLLKGTMTRLTTAPGPSSYSNPAMSSVSQFTEQFAGTTKDYKQG